MRSHEIWVLGYFYVTGSSFIEVRSNLTLVWVLTKLEFFLGLKDGAKQFIKLKDRIEECLFFVSHAVPFPIPKHF